LEIVVYHWLEHEAINSDSFFVDAAQCVLLLRTGFAADTSDTAFLYMPAVESIRLDATFSMLFSVGANVDVNILQMRRSVASGRVLGLRTGIEGTRWSWHERGPFARDIHVLLRTGTFVQHTRWDVFAGIAHRTTFGTVATNNIGLSLI
jgi:hypothetical protein